MSDIVPATGAYLEQILQQNYPIWGEGLSFPQYRRLWEAQLKTPWGSAHLDRMALVEGGKVTSSAKRYDLTARIDGRIRRVLGIGAVFTSPERRGRGGARRLLERVLESAVAEGYEFALLFSEIDPRFYEALDFVPMPLMESRLIVRRKGPPAVLMRSGHDSDIPAIAEISAMRSASARFSLDRTDDWIRYGIAKRRLLSGLGPPGLRETEFLVTEEAYKAVAYIVTTVQDGRWYIEDAGDRDPSGARLGAMLQTMLARTTHVDHPEIRGWLPVGWVPPQAELVESKPTTDVMMIRPLQDRTLPLPPIAAHDVVYPRLDYF